MLKITLFIFFCLFSLHAFAKYDEAYYARGTLDNGDAITGMIYTNDQPLEVRGQLTDVDGNTHDYYGRWNGRNQVTGQTDEGVAIDLTTYEIDQ